MTLAAVNPPTEWHAEHLAKLAATDPRYARMVGGVVVPAAKVKSLPCVHVGEPAGPRGWHLCEHKDEPLGLVVCGCRGCGVRCPGYSTVGTT